MATSATTDRGVINLNGSNGRRGNNAVGVTCLDVCLLLFVDALSVLPKMYLAETSTIS